MRSIAAAKAVTALSAVSVLLLGVTACGLPGFGPDPEDAVDRLARALSSRDLEGVDFDGGSARASAAYAVLTDGVADAKVSAGSVSADGDAASGSLTWRLEVGSRTWSYETEVSLAKGETSGNDEGWLVRWSPTIVEPSLKAGEKLTQSVIEAERGEILGAGDKPIVTPRPVVRVGIDKEAVPAAQAAASATSLARLVDVDAAALVKQVTAAGPRAFVQAIVYRSDDTPPAVLNGLGGIQGARGIADDLPLAPTRDFAAAVLGSVGPATAELVEESKGRIRGGDDVGISGLQKRYDEQLSGTPGATIAAVDEQGERRTLFTAPAEAGSPLRTNLDLATQQQAEEALAAVGPASALVAIRPSTGALVAIASGPGSEGYGTATLGQYAPGSTFKIVTSLALLRSGVEVDSEVNCPRTTVVDGKTFKNYDDYPASALGRIRLQDALANSCNTAFIGERDKLRPESLTLAAAALGLGVDHDTGFSSYFGQVVPPQRETQRETQGETQGETQAAASMIGQGTVLASPMALAAVVASVVKGSAVLPTLLPDQQVAQKAPARPLTAAEAGQLRFMMGLVVERGSGALLQGLPGGKVIAKTGTAEFGDRPPLPTHAWMVAGRDDLAVAVFVERGDSGSGTAGPILRQFLDGVR